MGAATVGAPAARSAIRGKKIAYIRRGLFSNTNPSVGEQLRAQFPECEIEEIDVVGDILRQHRLVVLINVAWLVWHYWREMLRRRQTVRLAFYRTPYLFRKIRELVRERLRGREHEFAFSIQTQSLYDASTPGLPHFVYTDHTHLVNLAYPAFPKSELFARSWIDLEHEIYRNAERVFVMSEHVRRSLIEQYAADPRRVARIGVGSNLDPAPTALRNGGYANQTVLFVGIDWRRKGGPALLAAFDLVLRELPEARLVIAGCAPEVRHARIEVLGRISAAAVKARMAEASVFCLPTRIEPFGIVVVEAFCQALPVVATRIGALSDLVREGETGLLVPPDDPPALAAALLELLRDPAKCRRFGERGSEMMRADYAWDAVGAKLRAGVLAALEERRS